MAKPNITLLNATYSGVAGVQLPKQGGGTATFPWVEGSETKTQNGTYDVTSLAEVVVNVAGSGWSVDTVTVSTAGNPVTASVSNLKGQPKAFFLIRNNSMQSSGSTTYYYIFTIAYDGTTHRGTYFRIGGTRAVYPVDTGYTSSYSNGTLTITSSAADRTKTPGAYAGDYTLTYFY